MKCSGLVVVTRWLAAILACCVFVAGCAQPVPPKVAVAAATSRRSANATPPSTPIATSLVASPSATATATVTMAPTATPSTAATMTVTSTPTTYTTSTPTVPLPTATPTRPPTAEPTPALELALKAVGQIGGTPRAIALHGDVAYLGLGGRLAAVDVTKRDNPTILATSPILGTMVEAVVVEGDIAYVAASEGGLWVLDVRDRARLAVLGSVWLPGRAQGVAVRAGLAFVAASEAGLQVVDVHDPAAPQLIAGLDTPANAWCVAVAGDTALVGDAATEYREDGGLYVVDVSRPAEPRQLTSLPMIDVRAVAIAGQRAYVAARGSEGGGYFSVHVLDISRREQPTQIAELMPTGIGIATDVVLAGGRVYERWTSCDAGHCAAGWKSVDALGPDLLGPTAPALPAEPASNGAGRGMAIAGDRLYLVDDRGLEIADVAPSGIAHGGTTFGLGSVDDVLVHDGIAYAITDGRLAGKACLRVLDVRQPEQPVLLASFPLPRTCQDCEASPGTPAWGDGYLVLPMTQDGLLLIDVRDPSRPTVLARVATPSIDAALMATELTRGVYLVEMGGSEPLLLDVRDLDQPRLASLPLPLNSGELAVDAVAVVGQPLAVMLTSTSMNTGPLGRVRILDVSDPMRPQQLSSIEVTDAAHMAVADGFVYVSAWRSGAQPALQVLDIHDPYKPERVALWSTVVDWPYTWWDAAVTVADRLAYAAGRILDISDPRSPREVGQTEALQRRAQIAGEWVLEARREGGLRILRSSPVGTNPG